MSMGLVVPVLPSLVADLGRLSPAATSRIVGVSLALWALMQFLASPLTGALADAYGRRPVILVSNIVLAVDHLAMAFAPAVWILMLGRIVAGFCSSTVSTAYAYVSDVTPPGKRSGAFALLGTAFGLAFVLGPVAGGLLGRFDLRLPFLVAGVLGACNVLYGAFVLPESLPVGARTPFSPRAASPMAPVRFFRATSRLSRLGVATFVLHVSQQVLPACAVLYMQHRYGWTVSQVGLVLAAVGTAYVVIQAAILRPLAGRIPERQLAIFGFTMGFAGFTAYGSADAGWLFLLAIPVMELWSFAQPSVSALMSREVPADTQGRLHGANAALAGLAGVFGPMLFAGLFSIGIDPAFGLDVPGLPFFAAAILMLAGLAIVAGLDRGAGDANVREEPPLP
jgi:DHA1 family tetracycline resistance protein-like MFS transporter